MTWLAWFVFLLAVVIVGVIALSIWRDRDLDRLAACASHNGRELESTLKSDVDAKIAALQKRLAAMEKKIAETSNKKIDEKTPRVVDDLYVKGNATVGGMLKLGNVILDAESQDKITICDARGRNCMRLCCSVK